MRIHDLRFLSLREYVTQNLPEVERPGRCPNCGSENCFWKNGSYQREVQERELIRRIKVPRFKCRFCRRVLSVLLAFLIPYRRYTAPVVIESTEAYIKKSTSYREIAHEVSKAEGDEPPQPAHTRLFEWVKTFSSCATETIGVRIHRACVREGKDKYLGATAVCPNADKAHSKEKCKRLNLAAAVLREAIVLVGSVATLENLRTYFLQNFQSPFDVFCGNASSLSVSQNSEHSF